MLSPKQTLHHTLGQINPEITESSRLRPFTALLSAISELTYAAGKRNGAIVARAAGIERNLLVQRRQCIRLGAALSRNH
jgi:hypothetical protein